MSGSTREMEANVHPLYEEHDILAAVAEVRAVVFPATYIENIELNGA